MPHRDSSGFGRKIVGTTSIKPLGTEPQAVGQESGGATPLGSKGTCSLGFVLAAIVVMAQPVDGAVWRADQAVRNRRSGQPPESETTANT
jgi:hypothetical protein